MQEKMIRSAKNMDIMGAVFEKALLIGFALVALLAVLVGILNTAGFGSILQYSQSLDLGGVTLELADGSLISDSFFTVRVVGGLLIAAGVLLAVYYAVKQIRNILAPMKEGRPFEAQCAQSLKNLAILVFAAGGVWEIGKNVLAFWIFRTVPIESLFAAEEISAISYNYTIDVTFLFFGAVLMLMSYVFQYGEALQRESDETL